MKKILILLVTMLFGSVLFTSNATALPMIEGEIGFSGDFTTTGGSGIGDATGLSITDAFVMSSNGDLSVPRFTSVAFSNFTFDPPNTPINPLWSVSGFRFDLESVSVGTQSDTVLTLSGSGILHHTDFDDTPGLWNFTGNSYGSVFTFSSGSVSVPDANIMLLLGTALIGLGLISKKRSKV